MEFTTGTVHDGGHTDAINVLTVSSLAAYKHVSALYVMCE